MLPSIVQVRPRPGLRSSLPPFKSGLGLASGRAFPRESPAPAWPPVESRLSSPVLAGTPIGPPVGQTASSRSGANPEIFPRSELGRDFFEKNTRTKRSTRGGGSGLLSLSSRFFSEIRLAYPGRRPRIRVGQSDGIGLGSACRSKPLNKSVLSDLGSRPGLIRWFSNSSEAG